MTSSEPQPRPRNVPGLIGFFLAVLMTLAQVVQIGVSTAIPVIAYENGVGAGQIGVIFAVIGVGHLLLAVATAVFGLVGVTRSGLPKILAAIALGVGCSGAVIALAGLVLPPLVGLALP